MACLQHTHFSCETPVVAEAIMLGRDERSFAFLGVTLDKIYYRVR